MQADAERVTPGLLAGWPLPEPGRDKEARGRALVVGGTSHTPGAVLLAGEAVLRAGAGKLQIATAEPVAAALAVAVPEALVVPLPVTRSGDLRPDSDEQLHELAAGADTVLLGPGFSDVEGTIALLERLLPRLETPVVLDALASAYLGERADGVAHLTGRAVLTVNPGELAKTLDVQEDAVEGEPVQHALELARRSSVVVLCGGQGKFVGSPSGRSWSSSAGGPGLGVSGSGDVQAGLVAGLLSRGAAPEQAAVWGGHLHGVAGEQLSSSQGEVGYLAREIAPLVPALMRELAGG